MSSKVNQHMSVPEYKLDSNQLKLIAQRYPGRWLQGYVRGKLGSDPVYAAAAHEIGMYAAPVLDIGCGIGLFAHYLRATGCNPEYFGLDLDAHKINLAQSAADKDSAIHFAHRSCETLPAWRGHVVMLDILHYLTADLQQSVLRSASQRVAPGACLVIRSVLRDGSWRFAVTRVEEIFMQSIRWMRYGVQHYPGPEELHDSLTASGLNVEIRPLWGRTPFASYLIVARRPAD